MSDNPSRSQRRAPSRRQVLTGAAGAVGAVTAGSLATAAPAQANDGDPVFLGLNNTETNPTVIVNTTQNQIIDHANGLVATAGEGSVGFGLIGNGGSLGGDGVRGHGGGQTGAGVSGLSDGGGFGVQGQSFSGSGVYGNIDDGSDVGTGVEGVGPTGVAGRTNQAGGVGVSGLSGSGFGVQGHSVSGSGVFGDIDDGSQVGAGVYGVGPTGVAGHTHQPGGVAVRAHDDGGNGKALDVAGVAAFSRSGVAIVPAGSIQVTVPSIALAQESIVFALVQLHAPLQGGLTGRVWATSVLSGPSAFTIFVNKSSTVDVQVAWFVVN
jgi:hypothetical protein